MPDWLWIQNVVFPILGMGLGLVAMVGVYKTVNRWLDRRHERALAQSGAVQPDDMDAIRRRLDLMDDLALRLQELEERVDFAERVLVRGRDPSRLVDPEKDA